MNKCEMKRLQDDWQPRADKLVELFSETLNEQIRADAQGALATLVKACNESTTLDRDFLTGLATGEHLTLDLPLCARPECKVCH